MIYRTLGRTGPPVSIVSYGASPLGSVFRAIDEADGIRTVRTAMNATWPSGPIPELEERCEIATAKSWRCSTS